MSNIIIFDPPTPPQYTLRKQGELVSHFEFMAAKAVRDEQLTDVSSVAHYSAPSLLDPFAEWWER